MKRSFSYFWVLINRWKLSKCGFLSLWALKLKTQNSFSSVLSSILRERFLISCGRRLLLSLILRFPISLTSLVCISYSEFLIFREQPSLNFSTCYLVKELWTLLGLQRGKLVLKVTITAIMVTEWLGDDTNWCPSYNTRSRTARAQHDPTRLLGAYAAARRMVTPQQLSLFWSLPSEPQRATTVLLPSTSLRVLYE